MLECFKAISLWMRCNLTGTIRFNWLYIFVHEGNGGRFSGGFDINVFEKVHKTGMIQMNYFVLTVLA